MEYQKSGKRHQVFAPLVILAAGGIGSPVILRQSGIRNAGYDFFFDPVLIAWGKITDVHDGRGIPMSAGIHFKEDGIMMTDLPVTYLLKLILDAEVFKFRQMLSYSDFVSIMIRVRDELGGHLTDRGRVRKKLSQEDKRKLMKGYEHARAIYDHVGASERYKSWYLAAHPGGTVKIGEMVDENLKTEIENLYVCDCSMIPEEFGQPPTLTLTALGK